MKTIQKLNCDGIVVKGLQFNRNVWGQRHYFLASQKFTKIGTMTSRRAGLSPSKESQRSINDDSAIGT
jgi:hypothetical protein